MRRGEPSFLATTLHPYWNIRCDLSCLEGVPIYGNRIVVPQILRGEVLDSLHSAHQGVPGMKARARASVYWPNINAAISNRRAICSTCDRIGPSLPAEPLLPSPSPEYPFDQVVADYFKLSGMNYLVYADRYTSWTSIFKSPPGESDATSLKQHLRMLFSIYGAPRELASDEGPPFMSHDVQSFLRAWGVHHRVSSAYYPQSNGRAELAVKVAKRILLENVGPRGDINNDKVARALLQHRNTPIKDIGLSPAQLLYGRALRDCIPTLAEAHKIRPEWRMVADDRERALAKRNLISMERFNEHTKELPELIVGDHVAVQNQAGPRPNKWEKTGIVVERGDNRQYMIRMDGSGRCTLRNRRFIKKIMPVCADAPLPQIQAATPTQLPMSPVVNLTSHVPVPSPLRHTSPARSSRASKSPHHDIPPQRLMFEEVMEPAIASAPPEHVPAASQPMATEVLSPPPLRRSSRVKHPTRVLSPTMTGKSHNYIELGSTSTHSVLKPQGKWRCRILTY